MNHASERRWHLQVLHSARALKCDIIIKKNLPCFQMCGAGFLRYAVEVICESWIWNILSVILITKCILQFIWKQSILYKMTEIEAGLKEKLIYIAYSKVFCYHNVLGLAQYLYPVKNLFRCHTFWTKLAK